jgi:hypothetical protein
MRTPLEDEMIKHIDALMQLTGLDKSESATIKFMHILGEAVVVANEATKRSQRKGLSFDCRWVIVERLLNWKQRYGIAAKD